MCMPVLSCFGRTTCTYNVQVWQNEFDLGFRRNLAVTLGLQPPFWAWALLVPLPVKMRGDGMTFPTVHSVTADRFLLDAHGTPEVYRRQRGHHHQDSSHSIV